MSNDVHLSRSRVNKISKAEVTSTRRCVTRTNSHLQKGSSEKRQTDEDNDFLFGSLSPRGGHSNPITMLGELESPDHTQRDTTESDNNISSCSTLDIVNKVENVSLQQLEKKVLELTKSLQNAENDRLEMQKKLEECTSEKDMCLRRLEMISSAHECRITEMHCVIAELTKKLRTKQENTILEEQEPDELSYQEGGSVYNSEMNLTNPDVECQTDPLDNCGQLSLEGADIIENDFDHLKFESLENLKINEKDMSRAQIEALQEEVLQLKAQIAFLQSEAVESSQNMLKTESFDALEKLEEKEVCQEGEELECLDGNDTTCSIDNHNYNLHPEDDQELNNLNLSYHQEREVPQENYKTYDKIQKSFPKKAELVKLNCVSKTYNESNDIFERSILNQHLENVNIVDRCGMVDVSENEILRATVVEMSKKIEHLQLQLEQSKVQNTMLSLNLEESKEHSDHLYLLCGKYESNAVALQTALNCSDRAIEAYDVMLALLESKLTLSRERNEESRAAVETVAKHLLERLDSEKNICENSLGPWQNAFSIPDKSSNKPWTLEDDNRLRYHVSKLKGTRATVQNTIVNLESPFSDFYEKSRLALNETDKEKAEARDFAITLMMNEMLQLREENLNLRNKIDDIERDSHMLLGRNTCAVEDTLQQLQLQLKLPSDNVEAEHAAITEQQLVEALSRESELKNRIQTLMAKNISNDLDRGMRDLQKTNLNLEQQLEQNRRKYQSKIKKLEKKLQDLSSESGRENSFPAQEFEDYREKYRRDPMLSAKSFKHKVPETTL